jgi:DNA-binding transcriptional ArsR family regulator
MPAKPKSPTPKSFRHIEKAVDRNILSMFPSLRWDATCSAAEKRAVLQRLACLQAIGVKGAASASELAKSLGLSRPEVNRELKHLASISLVKLEKSGKTPAYAPTALGYVALTAFPEFQDWEKTKTALCSPQKKNDPLAYALIVIGYCNSQPKCLCEALTKYAAEGHTLELAAPDTVAGSLLAFYRQELRRTSPVPPHI